MSYFKRLELDGIELEVGRKLQPFAGSGSSVHGDQAITVGDQARVRAEQHQKGHLLVRVCEAGLGGLDSNSVRDVREVAQDPTGNAASRGCLAPGGSLPGPSDRARESSADSI